MSSELDDTKEVLTGMNIFLISLISGGFAGLMVDIILFPIDTIKTRLQSEKSFWRAGGFRSIYDGLGATAAGSVPTGALFFCTYESLKSLLPTSTHTHFVHMFSAAVGEVVSCLVRVPVEIAKKRQQVRSKQYECVGAGDILFQAYRTEGIFNGLYRGFGATVLREIPFAFVQFPLWEHLKLHWTSCTGWPLTFVSVAICGAISGGIAGNAVHFVYYIYSLKLATNYVYRFTNNFFIL